MQDNRYKKNQIRNLNINQKLQTTSFINSGYKNNGFFSDDEIDFKQSTPNYIHDYFRATPQHSAEERKPIKFNE